MDGVGVGVGVGGGELIGGDGAPQLTEISKKQVANTMKIDSLSIG